jgi:hypothetical protein
VTPSQGEKMEKILVKAHVRLPAPLLLFVLLILRHISKTDFRSLFRQSYYRILAQFLVKSALQIRPWPCFSFEKILICTYQTGLYLASPRLHSQNSTGTFIRSSEFTKLDHRSPWFWLKFISGLLSVIARSKNVSKNKA